VKQGWGPGTHRSHLVFAVVVAIAPGCVPSRPEATRATDARDELPPAYTRDKIVDPRLAEIARSFAVWLENQKAGEAKIFLRFQVLPPAPTLLPYGIGTYQKERRLPVILITGPGWPALSPAECEDIATRAFQEISDQLATMGPRHSIKPTLTIQTPLGLELGWINQLEPGRKLLHGID
jgi:hypothetical protein